jgi:hypothetical protein
MNASSATRLSMLVPLAVLLSPIVSLAQKATATASDKGVKLEIDGQLFSEYLTKDVPKPCMFPLVSGHGVNVLRNYPLAKTDEPEDDDHPHHQGLWFGHGEVNDTDFWALGGKSGKIVHEKFENITASGATASFTAFSNWQDKDGDVILKDKREVKLEARADGARVLDFTITLTATDDDVTFGDTKEGTMAIRFGTSLSMKRQDKSKSTGKAINSKGTKNAKVWGEKAEWCCFFGPDSKGNAVSVAMYDHPSNLRTPTWWHSRDYGLFAANPFGQHDFEKLDGKPGEYELKEGQSLTLKYRIHLLKGEPDETKFAAEAKAFAATK